MFNQNFPLLFRSSIMLVKPKFLSKRHIEWLQYNLLTLEIFGLGTGRCTLKSLKIRIIIFNEKSINRVLRIKSDFYIVKDYDIELFYSMIFYRVSQSSKKIFFLLEFSIFGKENLRGKLIRFVLDKFCSSHIFHDWRDSQVRSTLFRARIQIFGSFCFCFCFFF